MNYCTNQVKAGVKGVGRKSLITKLKHSFYSKKSKKERNIRFTLHYYDDAGVIVIVTVIIIILRCSDYSNQFSINMAKDINSIQNSFPETLHKIHRKKNLKKRKHRRCFHLCFTKFFKTCVFTQQLYRYYFSIPYLFIS